MCVDIDLGLGLLGDLRVWRDLRFGEPDSWLRLWYGLIGVALLRLGDLDLVLGASEGCSGEGGGGASSSMHCHTCNYPPDSMSMSSSHFSSSGPSLPLAYRAGSWLLHLSLSLSILDSVRAAYGCDPCFIPCSCFCSFNFHHTFLLDVVYDPPVPAYHMSSYSWGGLPSLVPFWVVSCLVIVVCVIAVTHCLQFLYFCSAYWVGLLQDLCCFRHQKTPFFCQVEAVIG